jgi:hypothetical protein
MSKEEYLQHVSCLLKQEQIEPHLQLQILDTVRELLTFYSVEFVRELLPTFFHQQRYKIISTS